MKMQQLACASPPLSRCRCACRERAVFRPEQGPVRALRFQGPHHRALRHLLLPGGRSGGAARGAHGRALARAAHQAAAPRAAAAGSRSSCTPRIRTSSRPTSFGRHRRRHRRRDREQSAPRHPAVCRRPCRNRSRARPRARARVPVRHGVAERRRGRPRRPGLQALPLWFIEGMAEYLSLGPIDSNTAMWVREAASRDAMPSIDKLDDPDFFPYRYGHAFWAYVAGRWGDRAVGDLLRATGPDGNIKAAMAAVLGVDEDDLDDRLARGDQAIVRGGLRDRAAPRRVRPRADLAREGRRRSERHAGDQPRRQARGVPVGEVAVLDRHVCRRRRHRPHQPQAGRDRRAIRTSTACSSSRSAGDWAPDNRRFVFAALSQGPAGADDRRRRQRQSRSASTSSRTSARSTTRRGRRTASRSRSRR